jgi:hypothetical protein
LAAGDGTGGGAGGSTPDGAASSGLYRVAAEHQRHDGATHGTRYGARARAFSGPFAGGGLATGDDQGQRCDGEQLRYYTDGSG